LASAFISDPLKPKRQKLPASGSNTQAADPFAGDNRAAPFIPLESSLSYNNNRERERWPAAGPLKQMESSEKLNPSRPTKNCHERIFTEQRLRQQIKAQNQIFSPQTSLFAARNEICAPASV